MRTVQHDRALHSPEHRFQASRQSDVEYRRAPMSVIEGKSIVSDEIGVDWSKVDHPLTEIVRRRMGRF